MYIYIYIYSYIVVVVVQLLSCVQLCDSVNCSTPGRLLCPSLSPGVSSNSCPLSGWCHPTISSSVAPFSSCPQFFRHQGLFQWVNSLHQVAKVLELQLHINPSNEYSGLIPLGLTGLISLLSKGLSRVFSNTTVQKHQFFAFSFLYSPTPTSIHDWKNHTFDYTGLCQQSGVSAFWYAV